MIVSGQGKTLITINEENATLLSLLKKIETASKYSLLYNSDDVENVKKVTIKAINKSVPEVMELLLKGTGLGFKINENTIIISKPVQQKPQTKKKITGRVYTNTGEALPGVHVRLKGSDMGTTTDLDGFFELSVDDKNGILVASFIGYTTREVAIRDRDVINIELTEQMLEIKEAVVQTGYQTLSRRETASAVVQVDFDQIELISKPTIDMMLAGQIPGMMVLQTSGEPGSTPTIRIRGTSSIVGTRSPLWVLDGIILEDPVNVDLSSLSSPDAVYLIGNAIAGVNPKDIETITILKDASATAIYGSRAANGVIVLSTKNGKVGKPRVAYSGNLTFSKRIGYSDLQLMNAGERVKLSQEIIADNVEYSRTPINLGYEGLLLDYYNHSLTYDQFESAVENMVNRNTDWYDLLFRNTFTHNHSVNVSGGSDRTTYYTSLGYNKNIGTAKGSDQERYSALAKVNSWINKKLYVGLQVNSSFSKSNGFHSSVNPNTYAYETSRTIPCYNEDGSLFMYLTQQKSQTAITSAPEEELKYNILNELDLTGSNSNVSNITAQLNLQYNIFPWLRYKILGGFDQSRTNSQSWAKEESNYVSMIRGWNAGTLKQGSAEFDASPIPWGGILSNNDQRKDSYSLRNTVELSNLYNDIHLVNIMAALELRSVKYKGLAATYYGWQPDRGETISPALTTGYYGVLSSLNPTLTDNIVNNMSWVGSATYSYKDKITLNGNIRADGSNNFGDNPNYRFLPIWSLALKYTLSNENFLKDNDIINYLAIRSSYGIQGNIDKATSPDLIIRVGSKNSITGLDESYFKYLPNPDLRWEKTSSYNIGIDFQLLKPKKKDGESILSGTFDFYDKYGNKIIVSRRVSQVIGLDLVKINGGKIRNTGFEGSLTFIPYQSKDIFSSIRFIYSYNRNTLIEANKDLNITDSDKINGIALIEGQPIGAFYSYEFAGLNENYGFPMFYNDKGEKRYELYPEETHLVYSGKVTPDLTGGLDLSFRYKRIHVAMGMQYSIGGSARLPNVYRANYYSVFDPLANVSKDLNNRWREPGDELYTSIPAIWDSEKYSQAKDELDAPVYLTSSKNPLQMYDYSSARVARTDNIRLRNINVSYVFPEAKASQLGLESFIINFQVENLFIICDKRWQGRDPESGSSNTPIPKIFSIGLNLTF
jgi:TonB-linked SusC/RagA family outer membrane protein